VVPLRVDDVELALVGREREPVRLREVVGHLDHRAVRLDPVDVAAIGLALRSMPLVVALDPVAGVGEPDRAVGPFDEVVGAVEPATVERVRQRRDRTVDVDPGDGTAPVVTRHDATSPVDDAAVRVARGRLPHTDRTGDLVVPQHPVVGDVAEEQAAPERRVRRSLQPAAVLDQHVDVPVPAHVEPLVEALPSRPDPSRRHAEHDPMVGSAGSGQ
jgi:hypothetical protein